MNLKRLELNFLVIVFAGVIAPAIAEGLSVMAPTLGSLLPAVGIGGFAAAATAVGSVSGSIAIAASFGGIDSVFFFHLCLNIVV